MLFFQSTIKYSLSILLLFAVLHGIHVQQWNLEACLSLLINQDP